MKNFIITTDINCDLPQEIYEKFDIRSMQLHYILEGIDYAGNDERITPAEFYAKMRAGSMPQTMQVNPGHAKEVFLGCLNDGYDVLHIGFSSALSGSVGSAQLAAEELKEDYPDANIIVIDSLCASLGQGLLVYLAALRKQEGKTLQETAQWTEEHKLNLCHLFTVDDLNHLFRGGRVSKATAVIGTMLNVKPVLHVDNGGRLIPIGKARGRKQSLNALVDHMKNNVGNWKNDIVFISHGDSLEDAQYVADRIKEEFGITEFVINYVGPTIGAHSGPGTIALFFLGETR